jgi:outer membrane protein
MAALGLAAPAQAGDPEGKLQIKLLGSAVLPDGMISEVNTDLIGLPAGLQTEANDNYVPTIAIEYFFNPNVSVETICCTTQHDVDATAGAPGAELVADALIVPATLTLKYHFGSGKTIKPYIGAGPAFFLILDDDPGAAAVALGADDFKLDNAFGFALQAGVDVPLGDNGLALSLDAKKYFISADAHWYAGGTEVIGTEHKLDPWVLSAGLGFRF